MVPYLSNRLQVARRLQLVHTVALGLAVGGTLRDRALAATTAHADSEDNITYKQRNSQYIERNYYVDNL